MKKWSLVICLSLLVALVANSGVLSAGTSEYDAVYNLKTGGEAVTQKLFFKGGTKIRIEMKSKDGTVAKVITRLDKQVTWMLMDSEKMYMEQKFDPRTWNQYQCDEQKAKKIGSEKVLGYNCEIYEVVDGKSKYTYWLVPNSAAVVRSIVTDNNKEKFRMEATALHFVKQDDALFDIPAGYKKFTFNLNIPKM